jgi:hypothetical protein
MLFAPSPVKAPLLPALRLFALSVWLPLAGLAQDDFFETLPNGTRPPMVSGPAASEAAFDGTSGPSTGALSGRLVFTCAGHGWTWGENGWYTQRGIGHEMNEDYGNLDQLNFFVPYIFNAGATVVAFRPIGYQTNEVVLDNDSPGVKFSGRWFNSRSTLYYGRAGALPYRFALLDKQESATATYTPKFPAAGFYPVYTWVRYGADRTSQLYRILHTGGQTLVRIPHHMVGNGWVYLGTYYFEAGAERKHGAVIISNLQPSPGFGAVVVADAIRFGNGMGSVPTPGAPVSTYPREEEAAWYWVRQSLGQGQTNVLNLNTTDQGSSSVSAPPRDARAMNRGSEGNLFKRVYLGYHSNAGGGRGTIGLWNNPKLFDGTDTPHQQRLAQLVGAEVNDTFCALSTPPLEVPWFKRSTLTYARNDYAFGEINNRYIRDSFDATILEVAFHDSRPDALLLRDPKVRDLVSRCCYQALVRYMNEFDGAPLQFLPEPPRNPRATATAEGVYLAWDEPADCGRNGVESYLIYSSANGYGFGNPVRVPASQRSFTLANPPRGKDMYFRLTALNAGGESLPSAVVGCRAARQADAPRVLFVNGFTQFDRVNNPRQTIAATNYVPPSATGRIDRVIARLNNAFDYVVPHGQALAAAGATFDSCQRETVAAGTLPLEQYPVVVWAAGNQTTNLLLKAEEEALARYVSHGGKLFFSGSHIAEWLQESQTNACALTRALHIVPAEPAALSGQALVAAAPKVSLFRARKPLAVGQAADYGYFVKSSSRILPDGLGASISLVYPDDQGIAAVAYDGTLGGGKTVCVGFPFECISSAGSRARCLADVLRFFEFDAQVRGLIHPEVTSGIEGAVIEWRTVPGRKYQVQVNTLPGGVLWQNVGRPIVAEGLSAVYQDQPRAEQPTYRVVLMN